MRGARDGDGRLHGDLRRSHGRLLLCGEDGGGRGRLGSTERLRRRLLLLLGFELERLLGLEVGLGLLRLAEPLLLLERILLGLL